MPSFLRSLFSASRFLKIASCLCSLAARSLSKSSTSLDVRGSFDGLIISTLLGMKSKQYPVSVFAFLNSISSSTKLLHNVSTGVAS